MSLYLRKDVDFQILIICHFSSPTCSWLSVPRDGTSIHILDQDFDSPSPPPPKGTNRGGNTPKLSPWDLAFAFLRHLPLNVLRVSLDQSSEENHRSGSSWAMATASSPVPSIKAPVQPSSYLVQCSSCCSAGLHLLKSASHSPALTSSPQSTVCLAR